MGTRSTILFKSDGQNLCAIYAQYDGYLDHVGKELAEFLLSKSLVNGIGSDSNVFNGAGCLVAQYVGKHKDGAGGLYMISIEAAGEEEYNYIVDVSQFSNVPKDQEIMIGCDRLNNGTMYTPTKFLEKINEE